MNLRQLAAQILLCVLQKKQSLTAALEANLETLNVPKDRAFVQALCYGILRDYHRLDFLLNLLLAKPLRNKENDIKVLILIGLYQLRTMRVKPHAAVYETVASVGKKPWAKKLINGVLRHYLRASESLEKQADYDLKVKYSHPQWLIEQLEKDWGYPQSIDILQQNNQHPPMVLRVNLAQSTPSDYCKLLAKNNILADSVEISQTAVKLKQPMTVEQLPYFNQGWVSVQDTAAQFAATLLSLKKGQRILDLCAAPGGKTAAILELQPSLQMTAIDINTVRLQRIKDNLQRLKLTATIIQADATDREVKWWDGSPFERILLDAPCSALGVIRRHPDIKILRDAKDVNNLVKQQANMLEVAWNLLATGGLLLYATCSILKQENTLQIEQFLKNHPDSFEIPIEAKWGQSQRVGRQILTGDNAMDGFYYARLGKH